MLRTWPISLLDSSRRRNTVPHFTAVGSSKVSEDVKPLVTMCSFLQLSMQKPTVRVQTESTAKPSAAMEGTEPKQGSSRNQTAKSKKWTGNSLKDPGRSVEGKVDEF